MTLPEDRLDDAIQGAPSGDPEIDEMAQAAASLQAAFTVETPPASDIRAMFVEGAVAAGRRPPFPRLAGVLALGAALLLVVALAGRQALPGHTLYSVRQILSSVGLAESAEKEASDRLKEARDLVVAAEALTPGSRARALAVDAIGELGVVRELATGIDEGEAAALLDDVAALEDRAAGVIAASGEGAEEPRPGDDQSGSASNDGSDDGDRSNDGDGSNGSTDDETGDDRSGDDAGGDDGAGEGSGPSDANDDNSSPSGSDDGGTGDGDGSDDKQGKDDGPDGDHSGPGGGDDRDGEIDDGSSGPGSGEEQSDPDDQTSGDTDEGDSSGPGSGNEQPAEGD